MYKKIIVIIITASITSTLILAGISSINRVKAATNSSVNDKMRSGSIEIFAGGSIPAGYLLCDGSAVSRTTYSTLFNIIGTSYGIGDGSTTFNLPNFQGKVAVGKNNGTFNTLGKTGGEETHKITAAELPNHKHSIPKLTGTTNTTGEHRHGIGQHKNTGVFIGPAVAYPAQVKIAYRDTTTGSSEAGEHSHSATSNQGSTGATGAASSMNNLQPYMVISYIIKY